MHLLGKQIEATLLRPDGRLERLIAIRDWDYNWQETYRFLEPILAPKGSILLLEAVFDNSEKNPLNPHRPPRPVIFGEQTTDEMCFVFIGAVGEGDARLRARPILNDAPWQKLEAARQGTEEKSGRRVRL
jgi:hypothetical protein